MTSVAYYYPLKAVLAPPDIGRSNGGSARDGGAGHREVLHRWKTRMKGERNESLYSATRPRADAARRIGYWIDPSGWGGGNVIAAYLCKTGSAILDNLGLLFAVGVAVGMARDKDGASALSGLVGFMTITTIMGSASMFLGFDAENPPAAFAPGAIGNKNVFFGIMVGCVSGALYNRFSKTKLPDFLAFFSGRRCVPILTAALMSVISLVLLFVWPLVYNGLVAFGESLMGMGAVGAGIYASVSYTHLTLPTT